MPTDGGRRSAVLIHVAGTDLADARLVLEERGHRLRSQPGLFLPARRSATPATARRCAHRAAGGAGGDGAGPRRRALLGAFAPIPMPWRGQLVIPVLSWSAEVPPLGVRDPVEVERLVGAVDRERLPRRRRAAPARGRLNRHDVGPSSELPEDAFVWGFTAMILEQVLAGLGLEPVPADAPTREIRPSAGAERGSAVPSCSVLRCAVGLSGPAAPSCRSLRWPSSPRRNPLAAASLLATSMECCRTRSG